MLLSVFSFQLSVLYLGEVATSATAKLAIKIETNDYFGCKNRGWENIFCKLGKEWGKEVLILERRKIKDLTREITIQTETPREIPRNHEKSRD